MMIEVNELLTVVMAAKRLPVSEPTRRGMIAHGGFPCLRVDGRLFVLEADLRERFGREYQPRTQ
jgi:hypothetical protein